ncbi:hypothetical protein C3L33_06297, partial [Rhododendron williamsianum]
MSSTTNAESALLYRDCQGRPDHLASIQGLLDETLANLHHLSAEHRPQGVQLNEMQVLLTEIQAGQQQQYETMEHSCLARSNLESYIGISVCLSILFGSLLIYYVAILGSLNTLGWWLVFQLSISPSSWHLKMDVL